MKQFSFIFSFFLAFCWIINSTIAHKHVCQHDPTELEKQLSPEYFEQIKNMGNERNLDTAGAMKMRVTLDFAELDNSANGPGMDQTKKDYIIKIMMASKLFLENFIKVIPRQTPIKRRGSQQCIDIVPSDNLKNVGISNSDLHILVTYENNPNSSGLANAGACEYDPQPVIGRAKFNLGTMTNIGTSPEGFEGDFSTAIHEITHVLGFSGGAMQYWIDPDTGKPYLGNVGKIQIKDTVRTVPNVIKLKSKNVLETARRYFNCPTLDSFALENQGGSGSFGSHWERDLLQNEYMTASAVSGRAIISEFTAALLMDTGFYAEINLNMVEKMYWGRGKGCEFVLNACSSTTSFPEFAPDTKDRCDYYQVGYGPISQDDFSQCQITQSYENAMCYDTVKNLPNAIRRNNSGGSSKCFRSNALDSGYVPQASDKGLRCHKFTCSADGSSIDVNLWKDPAKSLDINIKCTSPNQVFDLTKVPNSKTLGSLTCPPDFDIFCNFPKTCKNFCSGNGVCCNTVCYCLEGFVGEDCSKSCPSPQVWDGTKCVLECAAGTYMQPDKTCKSTCPKGYFANLTTKACELCDKACSICSDATNKNCTECNVPFKLQGTSCLDPALVAITCHTSCLTCSGTADNQCLTCDTNKYLDATSKCQPCTSPCQTCQDSDKKCKSCVSTDYTYDSTGFKCNPICDSSCLTCSVPKEFTKCLTCSNGSYLSSGKCLPCKSPCSKCVDLEDKCLDCIANYNYNSTTNKCTMKCDTSCLTCSAPVDSTKCLTCIDSQYVSGGKCLACTSPCSKCVTLNTTCTDCVADYTYNSASNFCTPQCHTTCKTCSLPKNSLKCLTCNDGFYLDSTTNECKPCVSPCSYCTDALNCLTCISATDYTYDPSSKKCNNVCDPSCNTCSKPKDANSCLSCSVGKYLSSNQCKSCDQPCATCEVNSTKCLSCIANYNLNINICTPQCDSSCKTCSKPLDSNYCISCPDKFFLSGTKCLQCQSPCLTCVDNSSKCTACITSDYTYSSTNNTCTSVCDASCKTCSAPKDATKCLDCLDGFFLSNGSCKKCKDPCDKCVDSESKCQSCKTNYNLNSNACEPVCDLGCKTCTVPNDANSCLTCKDGTFLDGTKCTPCSTPCKTCLDNVSKCLSCISETDYTYDQSANKCKPLCDTTCKTCSAAKDATKCLDCLDTFFLSSGQCKKCKDPCDKCIDSQSKCLSCKSNYNLNSNTCVPACDSTCKTCTNPNDANSCLSCNDGTFLDGTKCSPCSTPCKTCQDNTSKCLSCISDIEYSYDSSVNKCKPTCDSTCKTCSDPKDATKCLDCSDGFFLSSGSCKKCKETCDKCIDTESKCLSCKTNYILNTNICVPVCDTTCKTCTNPNDANSCITCKDGTFLDGTKCSLCAIPCKTCSDNTSKCFSCISDTDYTYDSSKNQCNPICDATCKTCSAPKNTTKCLNCADGFFLQSGSCKKCKDPCDKCIDNESKCLSCKTNYNLNSNNCEPICDSTCKTCTNPNDANSCLTCQDGTFLDGTKCTPCSTPCKTCQDNASKCLSCISDTDYTYDSSANKCKPLCDTTCKTCSAAKDATKCLDCLDGFFLSSGQCKKCKDPCDKCIDSESKCLSCKTNYNLNTNICVPVCNSTCQTCTNPNDANSCLSCKDGYFLEGTKCALCKIPCKTCQDNTSKCFSCISDTDYTYDSSANKCDPVCDSSCKTCSQPKDASKCLECPDSFFLSNSLCQKCQLPCIKCQDSESKCLTCESGYILQANICEPICDSTCKTCTNHLDQNSCLSCNDGSFLEGTKCSLCQNHCKTCIDNSEKCLSCVSDTDYSFDSPANKCKPICDSQCLTCSEAKNPLKCLSCSDGSYLDSNQCKKCQAPCQKCENNATSCLSCINSKYTYDNIAKTCKSICHSSCQSCNEPDDPNKCDDCFDGYFLESSTCKQCQLPCGTCDGLATKCLSCQTGYQLNSGQNNCTMICDKTCKTCSDPYNNKACITCEDGFFLNSNKECIKCDNPCQTCVDSANKCLTCISTVNYQFESTTNKCNMICDSTCKSCYEPNDSKKCKECLDGSYLKNGECKKCSSPCSNCEVASNQCLSCISADYQFDSLQKICNPICESSCKSCSLPKDSTKCDSCFDGFYFEANKCKKCDSPCKSCQTSSTHCYSCEQNYNYDPSKNFCNPICDISCATCTLPQDSNSCTSCNDQSFLDGTKCSPCKSPCKTCQLNSTKCRSCISSDYLLKSDECKPNCDISCNGCTEPVSNLKCVNCADGYYNDTGACKKCQSPCLTCSTSSTKCLSCISNDYLLDAATNKCNSNCHTSCKTCDAPNDKTKCSSCFDLFFITAGQCMTCTPPCETCVDKTDKCLTCQTGYKKAFSSDTCDMICDSSCKTCTKSNDANSCASCIDGWFLDGSKCSQCTSPCSQCQTSTDNCIQCQSGYNLASNKCLINCHSSCKTCSKSNDALSCLSCNDEYFLDGSNQCQKCSSPCYKCVGNATKCQSCISNYTFNSSNNICDPICDSSCKTCSLPNDAQKCLSCPDGTYLDQGQCKNCQQPCKSCVDNSNKCLSCISTNFTFDSLKNICISICHTSCKTCSAPNDPNKCDSCFDNFYIDAHSCKSCTSPCQTCQDSNTKCLSCINGYTLNVNTCDVKCHSSCSKCSQPNDPNSCTSCPNGYFLDGSKCTQCQTPCQNCVDSSSKCLSCVSVDFQIDLTKNICNPVCDNSCKLCSSPRDPSKCISCSDGQYLDNGFCKQCTSPCSKCVDSSTKCTQCIGSTFYKLDINKCIPQCHSTCKDCSAPQDSNKCISCQDGFYLDLNQCKQCTSPCATCKNTAQCLSCVSGYNVDASNSTCLAICDSTCQTCSEPNNAAKCLSCKNGSFLSTNTCQQCQQPCLTCQDNSTKCLTCISTDFSYDKTLFKCTSSCHNSCKTCSTPQSDTSCTSCFDGFYLDGNQCKKCETPCQNCSLTKDQCTSCQTGYSLQGNKCIKNCHASCKTCINPNDPNSCDTCRDGYFLDGGKCIQCLSPCSKCETSQSNCLSCISTTDYNFDTASKKCLPICHSTCDNCSQPNSANACLTCKDGSFLDKLNHICVTCQQPCKNCESLSLCLSCVSTDFTYDSSSKKCNAVCDSSCLSCSPTNGKLCLSCKDGSYLNNSDNTCKSCDSHCSKCQTTSTTCTQCNAYYKLELNSSCIPICDSSCQTCSSPNDANKCSSCKSGFFLSQNSSCQKCQSPCATCETDASKCLTCDKGYKYNQNKQNKCEASCDDTCLTCNINLNPKACLTCKSGRYLESNECKECNQNCSECTSLTVCTLCKSNYALNLINNQCFPQCHVSCLTCSQPNSSQHCLTCPQYKILSNGSCVDCSQKQYLNGTVCVDCHQSCKTCSDSKTCLTCQDGYSLNNDKLCIVNNSTYTCHYTCKTCVGSSYADCITCAADRVLSSLSTSSKIIGTCDCPSGTSDFNKPTCEQSTIQETVKTTTTAFFISSTTTTTILSFVSANPLIMISLIEFSQTISFFTYVNEKPALGFDNVAKNLYASHLTKLFDFSGLDHSQNRSRKLQSIQQQNGTNIELSGYDNNSKIPMNSKYPQFVINALSIFILTAFIWLISALSSIISLKDPNSFKAKVKKIICISLPICIYTLTSQEFSLLIFYYFQQLHFETNIDQASVFLTFIMFIYILAFLGYLFYNLEYKKVLTKPMNIVQSSLNTTAKVHPIFGASIDNIQQVQSINNIDYFTFYIIHLYFRQNSFLNRNFVQFVVIRKIIASLLMTYGFKDALTQMVCLLVLYTIYWLYIMLSKPFKEAKHRIIYSVIETITLIMHILYVVLLSNSGSERQRTISFVMLILILCTLLIYMIVSFIYLALFTLQAIKKCGESRKLDDLVVNVSNHFGQNQSAVQLKDESNESKAYRGNKTYNPNQVQLKKQISVVNDKMNSSIAQNQSIYFDHQTLNQGNSKVEDSIYLESPQRLRQVNQQKAHMVDFKYKNNQNVIEEENNFKVYDDDMLPEHTTKHQVPQFYIDDQQAADSSKPIKKFTDIF